MLKPLIALLSLLLSSSISSVRGLQLHSTTATFQKTHHTLAQVGWRAEDIHDFDWNVTLPIRFYAANAFTDVQCSPIGEIFATQTFFTEFNEPIYRQYVYDFLNIKWDPFIPNKEIKAVRFDRNGRLYQLLGDNCIYNDEYVQLLCNVKDFEVLLNGKFIIIPVNYFVSRVDYSKGEYDINMNSNVSFQAYNGYRALGLHLERPVFVLPNGTIQGPEGNYKGICAVDLTVGIDS